MECIILAGGFGRRLSSIIGDRPKALIEYKGKPLINYIIEKIPPSIDIFVTTNRKFESAFNQNLITIDRAVKLLVEDTWSEEHKIGALSAICFWATTKKFNDDLLIIAADNYFEFDMNKFIDSYDGYNTLVAVYDIGDVKKARDFGVITLEGNKIVEFVEKPLFPVSSQVATACYIFPSRIIEVCMNYCMQGERDLLGSFIAHLVKTDEVRGFSFKEKWFDIGMEIQLE
jgi:glucose-1-phosphate thymidylyltransferase